MIDANQEILNKKHHSLQHYDNVHRKDKRSENDKSANTHGVHG